MLSSQENKGMEGQTGTTSLVAQAVPEGIMSSYIHSLLPQCFSRFELVYKDVQWNISERVRIPVKITEEPFNFHDFWDTVVDEVSSHFKIDMIENYAKLKT